MIVMKFGGTSVGNAERLKKVADIVINHPGEKPIVVLSAMAKVTEMLIEGTKAAERGDEETFYEIHEKLREKHLGVIHDLKLGASLEREIKNLLEKILNLWEAIEALGEVTPRALDLISSMGERLIVRIFADYLRSLQVPARSFDADEFVVTTDTHGNACPIFSDSVELFNRKVMPWIKEGGLAVITGFMGKSRSGRVTTLGRGGSDLTATFIGSLVNAREVWIWTDVDGVMTADPRVVPEARSLKELSFVEVAELSYYGAKVMHPRSLLPVLEKNIPVRIRNTFNPGFPGTIISKQTKEQKGIVKSITYIKDLTLLNVTGRGMLGIPGIAARVFKTVSEKGANILMISQSSSEQNICFVVKKHEAQNLVDSLKKEFELEIYRRDIEGVEKLDDVAIISVVGAGMRGTPGIAGKVFTITGKNGINVIAIAQGSSEFNISFVVEGKDAERAVVALHRELIES